MRAPTIRDVAQRAGVSKSLVSLVLRGSPKVRDARRSAVLDAVRELGYRPNAAARSLSERRTHAIGVLIGDLRNPWYTAALDGLGSVLRPAGLRPPEALLGGTAVAVICLLAVVPPLTAARYGQLQRDLLHTVFSQDPAPGPGVGRLNP